jgi:hypothetical protein
MDCVPAIAESFRSAIQDAFRAAAELEPLMCERNFHFCRLLEARRDTECGQKSFVSNAKPSCETSPVSWRRLSLRRRPIRLVASEVAPCLRFKNGAGKA